MRVPARAHVPTDLPGVTGPARVGRHAGSLLGRLRPGDVAVLDHVDLDRSSAQALIDREVAAVVNAGPLISGRYPNRGPELLVRAGVPVVDGIGAEGLAAVRDGRLVRVHDARLHVGEEVVAAGRLLDAERVQAEMAAARTGMVTQLETLTRHSTELLRREEDLLLHGQGVPRTATRFAGRSAVVVTAGSDHPAELARLRPYLREQEPVLVAVGAAATTLRDRGHRAHVVVLDAEEEAGRPPAAVLKAAGDVVVRVSPGRPSGADGLARMGVRPTVVETALSAEDVALLLSEGARLVVGVGFRGALEDLLDRDRAGVASTYLTRMRLGTRLVDAHAVPYLYSGRVRPHHLVLVMLAGLVALVAAVSVTPVGQEWFDQLSRALEGLLP